MKNREIKFRAWVRPSKMQYGIVPFQWDFCIDKMFTKCIESTGPGFLGSGGDTAKWELGGFRYVEEAEKNLMQYTGLKDKNGKEIFEGDVIKISPYGNAIVVWNESVCAFQYAYHAIGKGTSIGGRVTNTMYGHESRNKYQVIGNIYENPELLNETQKGDSK